MSKGINHPWDAAKRLHISDVDGAVEMPTTNKRRLCCMRIRGNS